MAAALNRLRCTTCRYTSQICTRRKCNRLAIQICTIHTSPSRCAENKPVRQPFKFSVFDLDPKERAAYKALSHEERAQWREDAQKMHDYMTSPEVESELSADVSRIANETNEQLPHVEINIPRIKPGLMSMGEIDEQDSGEDEEYEGDDISSDGHGELEQHREMREYARIMAWEMPLLSKLAKPFQPPTLDSPLRFRYTTYMGETHPASQKIVLEFCTRDLSPTPLTEPQRLKLIKLVGPRYNPSTDVVKMSSEMFETQAQNKRYLGDLVDTLIAEAQDGADMFEDVPLDFRHHRVEVKPVFPEGWKWGRARREGVEERRRQMEVLEGKREEEGRVVVGASVIEEAMKALPVRDESRVLLEAQQGKRGKGGVGRGKARQLR
ncbi:37S ribosomal protein S24, mitochondrial [Lecanora helva]